MMLSRTTQIYAGQDCVKLENESLALWAATSIGPRVLGLALQGGDNLFAVLPDSTLDCPGTGKFHFYGGHRLWYAPEDPLRTYLPDNFPVEVHEIEEGISLTQQVEGPTGIQKQLLVRLPGSDARVVVEHLIHNRGTLPVELAPWAITQLTTGGEGIFPLAAPAADHYAVLPNRKLALWPYSDLSSSRIKLGKKLIRLQATMTEGAFKLGFPNPSGWLAYWIGNTLFVKYAPYQKGASYFDYGSSSQCYCDKRFLELESLGPRVSLQPGKSTKHVEIWKLFTNISFPDDETRSIEILDQIGLHLAGAEE